MDEQGKVNQFLRTLSQQLPVLTERFDVQTLGIFGSYVRQEQHPESDLDVLVKFIETPSLLKFLALENYLRKVISSSPICAISNFSMMIKPLQGHIERLLTEAKAEHDQEA